MLHTLMLLLATVPELVWGKTARLFLEISEQLSFQIQTDDCQLHVAFYHAI